MMSAFPFKPDNLDKKYVKISICESFVPAQCEHMRPHLFYFSPQFLANRRRLLQVTALARIFQTQHLVERSI
jgi:hypothetical protein